MNLAGRRVLVTGGSGFIGTNLTDLLLACGAQVVNTDVHPPLAPAHHGAWRRCDVGSEAELRSLMAEVDPQVVLHLAARTDTTSDVVSDYDINHVGTANVVTAMGAVAGSAERFVLVSSQFVLGPGTPFTGEEDYAPHTAYGHSKVEAERWLRRHPPAVTWSIVRPTNVWGPWHLRYQREFWRVLRRRMYVHPSSPDPVRSYGYVGSVCLQLLAVLRAGAGVHGRALYLGDEPIRLSQWVDAFSVALRGRPARRVPGPALRTLARVGDVAGGLGLRTPIDSGRFRSMTEDYPTPMNRTGKALGGLPVVPLALGVAQTIDWLDRGAPPDVTTWLSPR